MKWNYGVVVYGEMLLKGLAKYGDIPSVVEYNPVLSVIDNGRNGAVWYYEMRNIWR
jgi:hypothetical protein